MLGRVRFASLGILAAVAFGCGSGDISQPVDEVDAGEETDAIVGDGGDETGDTDPGDADATPEDTADTDIVDTEVPETADSEPVDTGSDTGVIDTGPADTGVVDTGPADTGVVDTGPADTGVVDTGPADTGVVDTGTVDSTVVDTGPADTGTVDTGSADTTVVDSTPSDTGAVDTSPADTAALLPTVTVTMPTNNTKKGFNATSDACTPLQFQITANAPLKIKTLSWHFFTPTKPKGGGMNGDSCGPPPGGTALPPWEPGFGTPIFPFKIDETKYAGLTSGTFIEDIAVSGLYSTTAGTRWLWCTAPGTPPTAHLTSLSGSALPPPAPAGCTVGCLATLSNYCHATSLPADTETDKQWTLVVQLFDQAGNKATARVKFWVYKL